MRTLAAVLLLALPVAAQSADLSALPRSTPEAQGIPSSAILAFVDAAEEKIDALHSLMVVRHGHVVAEGWWEPYRSDDPHILFSLSKSFASTGIGLAVAEGRLSLDDTVLSFFPEDAPAEPSDNLKAMRVRDLLSMNTGHHAETIAGFDYMAPGRAQAFLALPVAHKPGTHFVYNTPASYMLSAIVQKVSGTPLVDYLGPRLFETLGIRTPRWDAGADGVSLGGFGLSIRTEDIARFGQLYLQKGRWQGQQILPAEWVEMATARQVSNGSNPESDWEQGYGFQFWRCRHGIYRGDGAFGQFCVVMPQQDAVVAITSGTQDLQGVLNLVWDHLLAGMKEGPLPADGKGHDGLQEKLASLELRLPEGSPNSPRASEVSGSTYHLPENDGPFETVRLDAGDVTTVVLQGGGRESRLSCGSGAWRRGSTLPLTGRLLDGSEAPVAVSCAWTDEDTYTVEACFFESPFCATYGLEFAGDTLLFTQEMNVGFGAAKVPLLVGRLEP